MADYDSAWKEALDAYFQAFLAFFFPLVHTGIDFEPVKLLDYASREAELEASANPFATLTLAHLKAMETHGDPASRQLWKLRLVRNLYERGFAAAVPVH